MDCYLANLPILQLIQIFDYISYRDFQTLWISGKTIANIFQTKEMLRYISCGAPTKKVSKAIYYRLNSFRIDTIFWAINKIITNNEITFLWSKVHTIKYKLNDGHINNMPLQNWFNIQRKELTKHGAPRLVTMHYSKFSASDLLRLWEDIQNFRIKFDADVSGVNICINGVLMDNVTIYFTDKIAKKAFAEHKKYKVSIQQVKSLLQKQPNIQIFMNRLEIDRR